MLVLSRKVGQSIVVGDGIEITVVEMRGDQVRIGIDAARDVPINRKEVLARAKTGEQQRTEKAETQEASARVVEPDLPIAWPEAPVQTIEPDVPVVAPRPTTDGRVRSCPDRPLPPKRIPAARPPVVPTYAEGAEGPQARSRDTRLFS